LPKIEHAKVVQLQGGGHAAVRVLEVESEDPQLIRLVAEGWECDALGDVAPGTAPAPDLPITLTLGMVAAGTANVAAEVERARGEQARQVGNMKRARAALAGLPKRSKHAGYPSPARATTPNERNDPRE